MGKGTLRSIGKGEGSERPMGESMAVPRLDTPLVSADEWALLAGVCARNDGSVRQFYRAYVDRVHRVVARILGAKDGDVEDVVQQVFLAAVDGAHKFEGRSQVSTWLIGIATRRAIDACRSRARTSRWSQMREFVGLGTRAMGPEDREDARSLVDRALASLTPDQRTAFVLCEVEGYTLQETADMTGVGVSTLHARLKSARRRLDALLASDASAAATNPSGGHRS